MHFPSPAEALGCIATPRYDELAVVSAMKALAILLTSPSTHSETYVGLNNVPKVRWTARIPVSSHFQNDELTEVIRRLMKEGYEVKVTYFYRHTVWDLDEIPDYALELAIVCVDTRPSLKRN